MTTPTRSSRIRRLAPEVRAPRSLQARRRFSHKVTAAVLSVLVFFSMAAPWQQKAEAQDYESYDYDFEAGESAGAATESGDLAGLRQAIEQAYADSEAGETVNPDLLSPDLFNGDGTLNPEAVEALEGQFGDPANLAPIDENITPTALPTGDAKSAVEPARISLPNAEGSVEGMGESFAPVLSSGTGTFSVPIAVAAGRAGVQPSMALSYASSGGNSCLGFGWSLSVPTIVRQSDRGLPHYDDASQWHAGEDRFFYNGGQELVPVDSSDMAIVDSSGFGTSHSYYPTDDIPADAMAPQPWQQYRARVEGGFMRFFRSPDSRSWIVQGKDGSRFDFGLLPIG
ncbi:MAG: hypothetical protein ACI9KE_000471, partial [Polyangiales bacterium]